jgi:hypothetical protein
MSSTTTAEPTTLEDIAADEGNARFFSIVALCALVLGTSFWLACRRAATKYEYADNGVSDFDNMAFQLRDDDMSDESEQDIETFYA